jgi:hypothetical protein
MSETNEQTESFGRTKQLEEAGYTPLKFHGDTEAPATDGAELTEREAKDHIRSWPEPEPVILKTEFHDKDGEKVAFEDPKTAAEALIRARARHAEEQVAPAQAEQDDALARRIDAARGEPSEVQLQQTAADTKAEKEADNKRWDDHLKAVRDQIEAQERAQHTQRLHNAEIEVQTRGMAVVAALKNDFPELNTLNNPGQIPTALAAIAAKNPARAQALVSRLQAADALVAQHKQITAAKQQHADSQFDRWSKAEDAKFRAKHSNDPNRPEVGGVLRDMLTQHGLADDFRDLASKPEGHFLRDSRVQDFLYSLAKQALEAKSLKSAKDTIAAKRAAPVVPPVVRPGGTLPGGHRALSGAANASHLNKQLSKGGEAGLRAAAQLLMQRRSGR